MTVDHDAPPLPTFIPIRVVVELRHETRMGLHPAAAIAALLKNANGHARIGDRDFPASVVPDPIEVGRQQLNQGEPYALGLIWCGSRAAVSEPWSRLLAALERVGRDGSLERHGLSGNFSIAAVESLVIPASRDPLVPIAESVLREQIESLRGRPLTLHWYTPLHARLPKRFGPNAGCFDLQRFPIETLAQRLWDRLRGFAGWPVGERVVTADHIRLVDPPGLSRLQWIKWQYGPQSDRQSLMGVLGRVVVEVDDPDLLTALVLGQYARVGDKTNFGLGAYWIDELGPIQYRAARATPLIELALRDPSVEAERKRLEASPERLLAARTAILDGSYEPAPGDRFLLQGDKPRAIALPAREDRVIQRALHDYLSPVLDRFLETSSVAYRRGLGRRTAADRIQRAYRDGWRWALKADFHQFFDSIDHAILQDRLEAYVQDDATVKLLMQWVRHGAPQPGIGLPTGAVVSPLLANLFLDSFDEEITNAGGLLIRYADDFVILFRRREDGDAIVEQARRAAERLKLHLHDTKTKLLDLSQPFRFLGYQFFVDQEWQFVGQELTQVEDLGWRDAPKSLPTGAPLQLSGETALEPARAATWILGPGIRWLGIEKDEVVARGFNEPTEQRLPLARVGELVVLGGVTLDASILEGGRARTPRIILADDLGRWTTALHGDGPLDAAEPLRAQVLAAEVPARRLAIAKTLISAKLHNYAALASAHRKLGGGDLATHLRSASEAALAATTLEQLLGIEGSGAAAWYGMFGKFLDRGFKFTHRVHPQAEDPVNVMLNYAQTILHRLVGLALVREQLAPSLGYLHQIRAGHAALASDLQEAYRHLMDRAVLETSFLVRPGDFHATDSGPFPLRMDRQVFRTLNQKVFQTLAIQCHTVGTTHPRSYRQHLQGDARRLRTHLMNPENPLRVFRHV